MRAGKLLIAGAVVWASSLALVVHADDDRGASLDTRLARVLRQHDFTGRVELTLPDRLGRRIEDDLANLGRLLWFDNVHSLHRDNTCGGCHSPSNGFGDTQSIAIGVDNNGLVGPNRKGPRNQRRSPLVLNTAFYPKLMWNGRFFANAAPGRKLGDPFSNMFGFTLPAPKRSRWAIRITSFRRRRSSADRVGRGGGIHRYVGHRSQPCVRGLRQRPGAGGTAPGRFGIPQSSDSHEGARESQCDAWLPSGIRASVS